MPTTLLGSRSRGHRVFAAWFGVALALCAAPAPATEAPWQAFVQAVDHDPRGVTREFTEAANKARAAGDEAAELDALTHLAIVRETLNDPLFGSDGEHAYALARQRNDAAALCWLGWVRSLDRDAANKAEESLAVLDESQRVAESRDQKTCLAWLLDSRAFVLQRQGRKAEAIDAATRSYALSEAAGHKFGMALALQQMASIHGNSNANAADLAKAVDYMQRAQALIDPAIHKQFNFQFTENMGALYFRLKDYAKARPLLERVLAISHADPDFAGADTRIQFRLGLVAQEQGRLQEALAHLDAAMPGLPKLFDKRHVALALLARADVLAQLGRRADAEAALAQGRGVLRQIDQLWLDAFYYPRAAALHARMGNYEQAYRHMATLWDENAHLAAAENARLANELKVRFDVRLKEAENELLRAQQREAETQRIALALAFALSVLLLGGLAWWLRRRAAAARTEAHHLQAVADAEARANHAKSTFLANMSHELRTPLNGILGFAQILRLSRNFSGRDLTGLDTIEQCGRHLLTLIDDLLDLARIEAGKLTLMPAPLELPPFLRAVADVVRVKAEHKGLHFECDVAPDLPLSVLADDRRLRQVLLNLLGNAVKFTDRGAVTLRVRHGADDAAADLLHFEVADTGPGIAPAHQQDIFKPFEQVGDVRRRAEGTGLGLAISLQLVRLMGGDIHLQSSPGEGSRFWFELRLAPARAEVLQEEARVVTGYEGPRRRLLIIDDVATNRTMLLDLLGRLGFECREAADSAQAIAIAESFRPALVLTDVVMPDVDGIEAARRIRALDGLQRVPVIAMSASVSREDEARVRASGIDAFVAKPIEYARLLEPIGRLLGLRWIEAPAGAVPPVNA